MNVIRSEVFTTAKIYIVVGPRSTVFQVVNKDTKYRTVFIFNVKDEGGSL